MTPAQRARKMARAQRLATEARALANEVCADYAAESFALTVAERQDWREAVDVHSALLRATA